MAMVGLRVKHFWYEVGSADFLNAFFSTIGFNLENNDWGSRFPVLMTSLYDGEVGTNQIDNLLKELAIVTEELKSFTPNQVVWDIENRDIRPPWGDNISDDITDLSNYFVTSDGRDLIEIMIEALSVAKKLSVGMTIESI